MHKCPGTGLETYFNAESPMEPPRKKIRSESQNTHDVSKTKSLEELAREVETGTIDMKKLMKRLYIYKQYMHSAHQFRRGLGESEIYGM